MLSAHDKWYRLPNALSGLDGQVQEFMKEIMIKRIAVEDDSDEKLIMPWKEIDHQVCSCKTCMHVSGER